MNIFRNAIRAPRRKRAAAGGARRPRRAAWAAEAFKPEDIGLHLSRRFAVAVVLVFSGAAFARAADLPALWAERVKCVVAVEFYVETEIERRPSVAYGTVIDRQGTIILPAVAVNARTTPSQLKEFKVYRPGNPASVAGEYLGQDALTGWHFVRAAESIRGELVPLGTFAAGKSIEPALAEEVWGIGLRNKDEDFMPYLLTSRIALAQSLPQRTVIAQQEVAGPGLPAFNRAGEFVGLASSSFGQSYVQFSRNERGGMPVIMVNVEESGALLVASEVLPHFGRIPQNVFGRPLAWLGAYGIEPVDAEAAKYLKLEGQSAAVISEVLEGSPAETGGLKNRDIVVGIDGRPLPRFRPDRVIVGHIEREIVKRKPGDSLTLTVLRDGARVGVTVTLGEQPRLFSEAERKYFDELGFTAREFVYDDAVARRARTAEATGVVAHFVKPNSPAAVAGLYTDDWIREIDGTEVTTFASAVFQLSAIEADTTRTETVLLINRGGETAVLRLKL